MGVHVYRVSPDLLLDEAAATTAALAWAEARGLAPPAPGPTAADLDADHDDLLDRLLDVVAAELDVSDAADAAAVAAAAGATWLLGVRRALRRRVEDGALPDGAVTAVRRHRKDRLEGVREAVRVGLAELRLRGLDGVLAAQVAEGDALLARLDAVSVARRAAVDGLARARAGLRAAVARLVAHLNALDALGRDATLAGRRLPVWARRRVLRPWALTRRTRRRKARVGAA